MTPLERIERCLIGAVAWDHSLLGLADALKGADMPTREGEQALEACRRGQRYGYALTGPTIAVLMEDRGLRGTHEWVGYGELNCCADEHTMKTYVRMLKEAAVKARLERR